MYYVRLNHLLLALGLVPALSAVAADAGWNGGIDFTVEAAGALQGAAQRGDAFLGLVLGHVSWEEAATANSRWHWRAYASVLALEGHGPTKRFLGDFLGASNMEGFNSTRLYAWWFEVRRDDWSLRGGALLADEEFATTEGGGYFLNSAFGWPAGISANTKNTGPAYCIAALGLRLERRFGEATAWRLGVYDGDSFDSCTGDPQINRYGWHYELGGAQGWFVVNEVTWAPAASANRFAAGVWLHTANFADVRDDASGCPFAITGAAPREHPSNYGTYVIGERTLRGKSGEAGYATAFLRLGFAPSDRNTIGWALDTGIAATGLLPGRPADIATLGVAHAAFSSDFAANTRARDPSLPAPDFEQVIEAGYTVVLSAHLTLTPDLQYIRHPGGCAGPSDAIAFLLRFKASY